MCTAAEAATQGHEARAGAGRRSAAASATSPEPMATLIVSSLEGAIVLSRAQRTTEPLERVIDQIEDLIEQATAGC